MLASWSRWCAGTRPRCVWGVDLLPGGDVRAFIDIDSLLRPVYGHAKQGASYGYAKIAGKRSCVGSSRRWRPRSALMWPLP
jgi:hypothetical protein